MEELAAYAPILCGTIPLDIDVENSDLDIVLEVRDFPAFRQEAERRYGELETYKYEEMQVRGMPSLTVSFRFGEFCVELFGQAQPYDRQYAYRHMLIEHALLEEFPHWREAVRDWKLRGWKTEPAFAQLLHLQGDPYEELLVYGAARGLV